MEFIEFDNVSYRYNPKDGYAVKNLSFKIEKGEYVAIIGHNGSGKSTTARLMNGLALPEKGTVTVDGLSTAEKSKLFEIRKRVGVVFQNPDNQTVASVVEDDIAFGPENLGVKRTEIGERIDYALKAVDMEEYRKATPSRLSGGQKQRIAIAGVLAVRPEVMVLDESTAMLDPKGRKEVTNAVIKLNKEQGMTVINITHYMDETAFADRILVLNKGEIIMQGTPEQIFSRSEELSAYGLDVPIPTKIAVKLQERGLKLNKTVLTEKDLSEALCELLQKN